MRNTMQLKTHFILGSSFHGTAKPLIYTFGNPHIESPLHYFSI